MVKHWTTADGREETVPCPPVSSLGTPIYEALLREWSREGRTVPGEDDPARAYASGRPRSYATGPGPSYEPPPPPPTARPMSYEGGRRTDSGRYESAYDSPHPYDMDPPRPLAAQAVAAPAAQPVQAVSVAAPGPVTSPGSVGQVTSVTVAAPARDGGAAAPDDEPVWQRVHTL